MIRFFCLPAIQSKTGVVAQHADLQRGERLCIAADHVAVEVKVGAALVAVTLLLEGDRETRRH